MNKGTGRCLEVESKANGGIDLILRSCTGQRWTIKNFIKQKQCPNVIWKHWVQT